MMSSWRYDVVMKVLWVIILSWRRHNVKITSWWRHMVSNFAQFCFILLQTKSTGKVFWKMTNLKVILVYFGLIIALALGFTIDKIAIIQERIKLFSNLSEIFRKHVKLFLLEIFFSREGDEIDFTPPIRNRVNKYLGPNLQIWAKIWKFEEIQKVGYSQIQKVIKKYCGKHVIK